MVKRITAQVVRSYLKHRPKDAHKGNSGRVLIIAGARGMVGAGILAANAAARSGAGLVRLATVNSQQVVAAKRVSLEVTTQALPEDASGHLAFASWRVIDRLIKTWRPTVVAFGPGLGVTSALKKILHQLLKSKSFSLVIDADGLNALSQMKRINHIHPTFVVTPHMGECARLLERPISAIKRDRFASAKETAKKYDCICLLKGPGTLVTDGKVLWQNTTGNPAMASGGMGDVLTGMIAAFWAQEPKQDRNSGMHATTMAAFMHGLAGDLAVKKFPERTLLASDVVNYLPQAFQKIWRLS